LENIVGDSYKINTIVPAGVSPETYEPTPAMMMNLGKAPFILKSVFWGSKMSGLKIWRKTIPM